MIYLFMETQFCWGVSGYGHCRGICCISCWYNYIYRLSSKNDKGWQKIITIFTALAIAVTAAAIAI